jgi:hypothetical protein
MTDIIVDPNDNNDLVIYNGDFFIVFSESQHIAHIIEADSGHYKQHPLLGVGIRKFLNGVVDASVKRVIQVQLKSDGWSTRIIKYLNGVLEIKR